MSYPSRTYRARAIEAKVIRVRPERRYPSEDILSLIEARLDHDEPSDVLGISKTATVEEACEMYTRMVREILQFQGHPKLGARALVAARRSRYALFAFCKGWPDLSRHSG